MIYHELNYHENMLPHSIQQLLKEDRRNVNNLLSDINVKFPDIKINLYWELKQESNTEYSVTLTKYDSNNEEVNEYLSRSLQEVQPTYVQLHNLFSYQSLLRS